MYELYIRCLIFIRKTFYLYKTFISRFSAIKSSSEMLAFVFAFSSFFVYFHSHHRASKVFWASKVFFQKCSLSLSHSFLYILTRIIEHRKFPRKSCHPRGLDLPLIQNDRTYPTTTCVCCDQKTTSTRDNICHKISTRDFSFFINLVF